MKRHMTGWAIAAVLVATGALPVAMVADTYSAYTGITSVSITSHSNNDPVPAGDDATLTCSTATDTDCNETLGTTVTDPVTHTWSGAGTFTPQTGTSTTWTAPTTPGDTVVTITADDSPLYDETPTTAQVTLKVHAADTVVWETVVGNTAIDACPKNGGKRIYPGKMTAADGGAAGRRTVTVKATITPVVANATVYFRVFDVDDPSSAVAPIDDETPDKYNDNRGGGGALSAASATTNASGEAMVTLTVSMQPGDNFRVTASTSQTQSTAVTDAQADDGVGLNALVKRAEMLTVWRKLHLEVDSMGAPFLTGNSTALTATVLTNANSSWVNDQFNSYGEKWQLNPDTTQGTTFEVTDSAAAGPTITTAGDMTTVAAATDPYKVEFDWTTAGVDADDLLRTTDIEKPDTGAFEDAFRDAYVKPVEDSGQDETATPWHFNFGGSWNDTVSYCADYSQTDGLSAADWWVAYVIGMYEFDMAAHDNDDDTEIAWDGCSSTAEPEYAAVYAEVSRDMAAQHSWNVAKQTHDKQGAALHEVGHAFELDHDNNATSVMWVTPTDAGEDTYGTLSLTFNNTDLDKIRDCAQP